MAFLDIIEGLETCTNKYVSYFADDGEASRISYSELLRASREIRDQLQACNLQAGSRVAIIGPNSIDWLKWDLALMQLDCVVVSLPDEVLIEEGVNLINALDLSLIVKDPQSPHSLFDDYPFYIAMNAKHINVTPRVSLGHANFDIADVCALTFSSGSSGMPKCLMINPSGIEWDIDHYLPVYNPQVDDCLLIFLPMTHQQQRLLVYAGYKLKTSFIFVNPNQLTDALTQFQPTICLAPPLFYNGIYERYIEVIRDMRVTSRHALSAFTWVLNRLPNRISLPLKRKLFKDIHAGLGHRMRLMITGMAPIKKSVLLFYRNIGIPLFEAYGLTETGVIAANVPGETRVGSVGKPVKGCEVTIANDGEVLVHRKHQTTFGHIELTGKACPFDLSKPVPTGDIGKFDSEGFLYLIGRKKEIIITAQGHKVHPEYLERMLHEHEAITQAVVFGDGQKHLAVVLFVRENITEDLQKELESFASQVSKSISNGIPIGKVILSTDTPALGNGLLTRSLKINRSAIESRFLRALFGTEKTSVPEPSAAELELVDTKILTGVQAAWQEVLENSNLPLNANFFDLGGDSLSAMRIINNVQEQFNITISLADMVLQPTIYGCARVLTDRNRDNATLRLSDVEMEEGVL